MPLNGHERTELRTPEPGVVALRCLRDKGINAIVRTPRGRDIAAACGQLGEGQPASLAQALAP